MRAFFYASFCDFPPGLSVSIMPRCCGEVHGGLGDDRGQLRHIAQIQPCSLGEYDDKRA
jgi:hypothetical protein